MAIADIDFEGSAGGTQATNADTNLVDQQDTTALNGDDVADITGQDGNKGENNNQTSNADVVDNQTDTDDTSSTGELEAGTQIEYDGVTYVINNNGDLVDEEGNIFKNAEDIAKWLKDNGVNDNTNDESISIDSIKEAIGLDLTDENGNPIEFTNDAEGVKSYVESVINHRSNDIAQGAVNRLFAENPMLKQFIDYVQVTGTPRGFGDIPDRSGIKLDRDNERQLEAIIRMAAQEFGNKSINDNYIKYLKDSGALYDEARTQLEALVGKDKAYKQEIERQAQAAREQEQQEINEYWKSVSDAISKRVINGYKLPESITREFNGQKITLTLNDFYNYLADAREVDDSGVRMTGYQRDLNRLSNEEALNRELLDAWLMFSGGSYKDLINMAVQEDKVRKLVVKSKQQRSARTIKVNKLKGGKVNIDDIILS